MIHYHSWHLNDTAVGEAFFFLTEKWHFIDHIASIHRVFRIDTGAELEIKPRLVTSQDLAKMCAASFKERLTCFTVAELKVIISRLISETTTPTMDRSASTEMMHWTRDRQSDAKITLSKPRVTL
jgi:hypothetical protein